MRIFTERNERSPYCGEHRIYDSTEEFESKNPGMSWRKWGFFPIETLKAGDWIRTDDGYVIEVLRVKQLQEHTYFVRVPMGTFPVYWTKIRGWTFRQLYAQFAVPHKGSASQKARIYHGGHQQKIKFAMLIASGISLTKAVVLCYPNRHRNSPTQLLIKARTLMEDPIVQAETRQQLEKFDSQILEKFSDKKIVDELELLIDRAPKGTSVHRDNIKFIMELRGLYSPEKQSVRDKIKSAQTTPYTEVPPSEADV